MPFLLFSLLFVGLALIMQFGGLYLPALGLGLVGSICLDVAIWKGIIKQSGFSLALKVFFLFIAFRKIFPLLLCFIALPLPIESIPWGFAILKQPLIAVLGYSVEGWCTALIVFLGQSLTQQRAVGMTDVAALARNSPSIGWFLGLAAVTSLFWWFAITEFDNRFFFIVRRFHNALAFAPFFVGLTCRVFPNVARLWILVLALQFGISFITGTRGGAFYPAIFLLTGYLIGIPSTEERRSIFLFRVAPLLCVLFAFGVVIGAARDAVGRTDLVTALREGTLFSKIKLDKVLDRINSGDGFLMSGIIRMTSLPPLAVPNLSPEPIPYRGFDDFGEELAASTSTRFFSGEEGSRFYWANWCLKPYGFAVNKDKSGRKTSSVELSSFVDGFTRGGWPIGIAWCLIGYTVWVLVELVARNMISVLGTSMFIVILITLFNPDRFGVHGLIYETKTLLLDVMLCAAIFYGISLLSSKGEGASPPNGSPIRTRSPNPNKRIDVLRP
jgi:hypothetical protein